jgi:hypothetical protein
MPVSTRKRSLCGVPAMRLSARVRFSPEALFALTITRTFSASSADTTPATASGDVSPRGCPWMSITGNFAFGTGCCGVTSVERGRQSTMLGGGCEGA